MYIIVCNVWIYRLQLLWRMQASKVKKRSPLGWLAWPTVGAVSLWNICAFCPGWGTLRKKLQRMALGLSKTDAAPLISTAYCWASPEFPAHLTDNCTLSKYSLSSEKGASGTSPCVNAISCLDFGNSNKQHHWKKSKLLVMFSHSKVFLSPEIKIQHRLRQHETKALKILLFFFFLIGLSFHHTF